MASLPFISSEVAFTEQMLHCQEAKAGISGHSWTKLRLSSPEHEVLKHLQGRSKFFHDRITRQNAFKKKGKMKIFFEKTREIQKPSV